MPVKEKTERNYELMGKRDSNPKKWSWKALADHYGFKSRGTAQEIYQRAQKKLSTSNVRK
jgi:hypothetical protein